jgi:CRP-like cAMP-binding protein
MVGGDGEGRHRASLAASLAWAVAQGGYAMPVPVEPGADTTLALTDNRLLAFIPCADRDWLTRHAKIVHLGPLEIICRPGEPISHAYFPLTGLLSIVALDTDGRAVEVGTVGNEGMMGLPTFLGMPGSPFQSMGEVPGEHVRVPMADLLAVATPGSVLATLLMRYAQAFSVLAGQSAACNRLHPIEERCARWLLMVHDRARADTFLLTHEVLSAMLGVRRPSITIALGIIHKAGFIDYHRGHITITNRPGLEAAACECYGIIRSQFARLFPDDAREQRSDTARRVAR